MDLLSKLNKATGEVLITILATSQQTKEDINTLICNDMRKVKRNKHATSLISCLANYILEEVDFYEPFPENGLVIYTGIFVDESGNEKHFRYCAEPPKKVTSPLYVRDTKFNTDFVHSCI